MGVESKVFNADLGCVKSQELDDLGACYTACGGGRVGVVSIDQGVGVGSVFPGVEEKAVSGRDGICVIHAGDLHGGRLSPDTVLLSFEEDSDITGEEEVLFRDVLWNDAVIFMKLDVAEAEMNSVPFYCVLVYSQEIRQKNKAIWIRPAVHRTIWHEGSDAAAATTTRKRGVAFSF